MIPAIVLAAGASSRMGRPKALLPIGRGHTFLSRVVQTLQDAGLDDVIVVLGTDAELVRRGVPGTTRPWRAVENPEPGHGQLSSLLVGLRTADRPGVRAVLVTLVDVPLVSGATVRRILTAYREGEARIVRPVRGGRHGHPVLFDRDVFPELRRADPSAGARAVVHAHRADALDVPVEDEGAFIDIDTPEAYAAYVDSRA